MRGVEAPERREHAEPELVGNAVHAAVLVVRRDRANEDPVHPGAAERPAECLELRLLPGIRPLFQEREVHRLRLERRHVEIRHVEEHGIRVRGSDREEVGHLPSLRLGDLDRVRGILAAGEEGREAHARPSTERA